MLTVARWPKLLPLSVMRVPPAVDADDGEIPDDNVGAPYENPMLDVELVLPEILVTLTS